MNALILRRSFYLIALLMLALLPSARAFPVGTPQTIHVPADYAKIQDAINAAGNGDTVLVADGTYTGDGNRDLDFNGKSLTVTSQNGPTKTIIDCGGSVSANHRGFYFHSGETNVAQVNGITIKNGFAPTGLNEYSWGGGMYILNSSPTIINCSFSNCIALGKDYGNGLGGGIYIENGNPAINSCTFSNNMANGGGDSGDAGFGGGISILVGSPAISKCNFVGNISSGDNVVNHIGYTYGFGGGLSVEGGNPTIVDCTFTGNMANGNVGYGAGFFSSGGSPNVLSNPIISNCAFRDNSASWAGGGVFSYPGSTASLFNCTFANNTASQVGGAAANISGLNLTNCILWGDLSSSSAEIYGGSSVDHSDIQGGYAGTGNIDANPLFVNAATGDLHLKPGSPCLGKGTPTGAPATDLDGNPRPNPPSIGAYELGAVPAAITGFTLSPNQLDAPGPRVTANVSVMGNFSKVTVSCAPGTLSIASPTFNLLANSGGGWGGSFPTAFLKTAKTNPITFIATGTRADGTTAQMNVLLIIGALPTLSLAVSSDKSTVPAGQTFSVKGVVRNLTAAAVSSVTVTIPVPSHLAFISSPDFTYNAALNAVTWTGGLTANNGSHAISVEFQANANTPANTQINLSARSRRQTSSLRPSLLPSS